MERLLVGTDDLATMLGVSRNTVRNLLARWLPCVRVGRRVLFNPQHVMEWLEKGMADPGRSRGSGPSRRTGRPRRIVL